MSDDKPFLCPVKDCGMQFTNEDHLNVHTKKHEMSLALNTGKNSSPCPNFLDQTPTPTNFLKNCCEEINLFQELSKNPFDDAYKKALDPEASPLPGPHTNELNTPTLILNDNPKCNSTVGAVSTSLLRNSESIGPSPLAKKSILTSKTDSSHKAEGTGSKLNSEDHGTSLVSPIYLSDGKEASVLQHLESKQAQNKDFTSQVADSTSVEFPVFSSVSAADSKGDKEISSSGRITVAEALPSPHSTTSSHLTVLQSNSQVKQEGAGSVNSSNVKEEPGELASGSAPSQQEQQCTMQVWLQLPSGQTVPISIPATINNVVLGSEEDAQSLGQQGQKAGKPQRGQTVKGHSQLPIQPQTRAPSIHPPLLKGPTTQTQAGQNTTNALKQRLKAQLQNQLSPTAKSLDSSLISTSNSDIGPAANPVSARSTPNQTIFMTNPSAMSPVMMMDSPGSELNLSDSSDYSFDSKRQKMSPDSDDPKERRRKFLERNRAAAARCRQKRKHWISNLEKKADELQNTNVRLQNDVKLLRGEVAHLKTLLLAHKDCPVTQQQRSSGQLHHLMLGESNSLTSQDLAQVVPTADMASSDQIQLCPSTIVTFVQESVGNQQHSSLSKKN